MSTRHEGWLSGNNDGQNKKNGVRRNQNLWIMPHCFYGQGFCDFTDCIFVGFPLYNIFDMILADDRYNFPMHAGHNAYISPHHSTAY